MTPQTAIELEFADGSYLFDLKLPQLAELQEKCGTGILAIYGNVLKGRYVLGTEAFGAAHEGQATSQEIFETIRLGLIGGGKGIVQGQEIAVSPLLARQLVERYAHPAPIKDSWSVAAAVLAARVEGYFPPKKAEPDAAPATANPKRKRTSPRSSPTAP